ncbi:MAG: TatD family hydrolase [Xanthomonadales bacterium]|nr:TatD family hydrolase [Xanthomonadales bacterium]
MAELFGGDAGRTTGIDANFGGAGRRHGAGRKGERRTKKQSGMSEHRDLQGNERARILAIRGKADAVKAVGETGLDYHRNHSPPAAQIEAFERQLQIAVDCGKPLFLHQRDAHGDFMAVLRNFRDRLGRIVVHCFTGTREEMVDYLDAGWHIGITGWLCDERRGTHLRELVRQIPAERLMIETDSPYLLPRTVRPKPSHRRNEPMYLRHIVEELARDRGEDVEVTAANATATSRAFFGL